MHSSSSLFNFDIFVNYSDFFYLDLVFRFGIFFTKKSRLWSLVLSNLSVSHFYLIFIFCFFNETFYRQPADRESLEVDQFVHNILSSTNTSIHQHVSVTLSGAFQPITAEHFNSRAPLSGGNSLNPHQLPPNRFLPNIKQEMPLIKYSQVKQEPGVSNNYIKLQHPSSNKTKVRGVTSQQDNGAPPSEQIILV